jgi:hypothetical protein
MEKLTEYAIASFVERAARFVASLDTEVSALAPEALRAWVERRAKAAFDMGLVEEDSVLRHLEVAARWGEELADEADTLQVLADPSMFEDWPAMRRVFEEQARGEPGEISSLEEP